MIKENKRSYKINDSMRAVVDCLENLVALEDHAFLKTDRCSRCLQKHLLKAHGASRDAIEQDHEDRVTKHLESLEKKVRRLWKFLDAYETKESTKSAQNLGNRTRRVRLWATRKFDVTHVCAHLTPVQ